MAVIDGEIVADGLMLNPAAITPRSIMGLPDFRKQGRKSAASGSLEVSLALFRRGVQLV